MNTQNPVWSINPISSVSLVIPNNRKLIKPMRHAGGRVIHITIAAGLTDCSDAPAYMRGSFLSLGNYGGQPAHQIIDEPASEPGDPVVRKTSMGALRNFTRFFVIVRSNEDVVKLLA